MFEVLEGKNLKAYCFEPAVQPWNTNFKHLGISAVPKYELDADTFENKSGALVRELKKLGYEVEAFQETSLSDVYMHVKIKTKDDAVSVYYRKKLPGLEGFTEIKPKTFLNHLNV